MVKIRLKRLGRTKRPFYRIVVMDIRGKRDGTTLADIGYYNPLSRELKLNKPLASDWIRKGAQLTETTERLYKAAPESGDLIVLEKARKERLSKKAAAKQLADAEAAKKAEEDAKAAKAAEAQKAKEEAEAAKAAAESPAAQEAPAAESETAAE